MTFATATLLLTLAGAPGVPGPDSAALKEALSAFDNADFDRCLQVTEHGAQSSRDDAVIAQLYLTRGRCYAALQLFDKVEDAFTHALDHDPEARLDPKRVLPTLVVLLDSLRVRLHGTLAVDVPNAIVSVDGNEVGPTPLNTPVAIGRHHVSAHTPGGGEAAEGEAVVRPNRTTHLELHLAPVTAATHPGERPVVAAEPDPLQLDVDAVARFDPLNGFGAAAGPSVRGSYWIAALHGGGGLFPSLDLELGLRAPRVVGPVGLFASAHGLLLFSAAVQAGFGGAAGLMVSGGERFEVFAEAGGHAYFGAGPQPTFLTVGAGVRIRVL